MARPQRTQLGRQATGLPRYYMDCGWYRHPRFAGLDPAVLFVVEAAVGYCTEHATNGRMPAHHEDLAAVLGVRASHVKKALGPLLERDFVRRDGDQLVIRGWAAHNPTTAEIEAYTEERSTAGSKGNHIRWHVERNVKHPECEYCNPPTTDRNSDRSSDRKAVATAIANASPVGSHGLGWDGMSTSTEVTSGLGDRSDHRSSDTVEPILEPAANAANAAAARTPLTRTGPPAHPED